MNNLRGHTSFYLYFLHWCWLITIFGRISTNSRSHKLSLLVCSLPVRLPFPLLQDIAQGLFADLGHWIAGSLLLLLHPRLYMYVVIIALKMRGCNWKCLISGKLGENFSFCQKMRLTPCTWGLKNRYVRVKNQNCRRPMVWPIKNWARRALSQW